MSLLARSFLLIALLLVVAVLGSFQIYRVYEREPRARELAQQTVSTVNLTRAALVNADPFRRRALLLELNEREGIRLYPATNEEHLDPLPADPLLAQVAARVARTLGPQTRFAAQRDAIAGFWVSFFIDDDEFWVMLPRARFEPAFGLGWLGWAMGLLGIALVGAWFIASSMARPLRALTDAAGRVGRGQTPEPVPEEGPRELRALSSSFNRMANDLAHMERERATVLAGISHDLRTPLARLRLELEMAGVSPEVARAMGADVEEIDAVIGQFLDYARGDQEQKRVEEVDRVLGAIAARYAELGRQVTLIAGSPRPRPLAHLALRRAVTNLVDNALRYAGEPVEIESREADGDTLIEVRDRGPGIPPAEAERMKQPFTRMDASRGGTGGSGLGLAIVERIARAHGGGLELLPREGGGLVARIRLRGTA
jgi:two-component system osmolarity sensor histidine kinase EnvZ